jgi:hypothetical protein
MANLILRTAIGTYGHTRALKNGAAKSRHFEMEHIEVSPVTSIFRRMVRGLEFDVAEMALSTYLCGRAHGKALTAIPIFLTRAFYHGAIVYNARSGIKSPTDLAGRKVGVWGYTVTPGVWTRGLLQSEYGLDLLVKNVLFFGGAPRATMAASRARLACSRARDRSRIAASATGGHRRVAGHPRAAGGPVSWRRDGGVCPR